MTSTSPILNKIAPYALGITAALIVGHAWLSVARLFARIGADVAGQILAGASSVGMALALAAFAALPRSASVRALASIYLTAWIPVTVALVSAEAAIASALVAVPPALAQAGRLLAGVLAGLALLPIATLFVAAQRQGSGDIRVELGHYLGNALKLVLLSATVGAALNFGLRRGIPIEVALFVSVITETAFLVALTRARDHTADAVALAVFGVVLAAIATETISVATSLDLGELRWLAAIGERLYVFAAALAVGYLVVLGLLERVAVLRHMRRARPAAAELPVEVTAAAADANARIRRAERAQR